MKITQISKDVQDEVLNTKHHLHPMVTFNLGKLESIMYKGGHTPPIAWSEIEFFDTDEEVEKTVLLPYQKDNQDSYHLQNLFGYEEPECSARVSACVTFLTTLAWVMEGDLSEDEGWHIYGLYQGVRSLAYSSDFLSETERTQFFNFTD